MQTYDEIEGSNLCGDAPIAGLPLWFTPASCALARRHGDAIALIAGLAEFFVAILCRSSERDWHLVSYLGKFRHGRCGR